jgi:hypothetical protein
MQNDESFPALVIFYYLGNLSNALFSVCVILAF